MQLFIAYTSFAWTFWADEVVHRNKADLIYGAIVEDSADPRSQENMTFQAVKSTIQIKHYILSICNSLCWLTLEWIVWCSTDGFLSHHNALVWSAPYDLEPESHNALISQS